MGYGVYGGVRAIESLRLVFSQLQVATVSSSETFNLMTDFEQMTTFAPADYHAASVTTLFDQVESWSEALRSVREDADGERAAA